MTQHTPTPWGLRGPSEIVKYGDEWACIAIIATPRPNSNHPEFPAQPLSIGDKRFDEACANAEFIVRAANAHDALVSVCERLIDAVDILCADEPGLVDAWGGTVSDARAALALANTPAEVKS